MFAVVRHIAAIDTTAPVGVAMAAVATIQPMFQFQPVNPAGSPLMV